MGPSQGSKLYRWLIREFTVAARAGFVKQIDPYLAPLVHRLDRVLDLCCGAGPFSFYFEERGADVTAIDILPEMIELARKDAVARGSAVEFIQADVLSHDLGVDRFDLIVLLGNSVSDFTLPDFVRLARKVRKALRQKGRFVVHYLDGLHQFIENIYSRETVQQDQPERIVRRFKEYLPETAAYREIYRNEATGEEYEYTSYLYNPPMVHLAVTGIFAVEQQIRLEEQRYLEIFKGV